MIQSFLRVLKRQQVLEQQLAQQQLLLDELNASIKYVDTVKQEFILSTISIITQTVNDVLADVFGPEYKFELNLDLSGKKPRITPQIAKPDGVFSIANTSGGLAELISLLVRLSLILMYKRKLLVLDEPFKFLDKHKKRLVLNLLMNLDFQVIMVTHDQDLIEEYKEKCKLIEL